MAPDSHQTFRFLDFVLDIGAYELRHKGRAVRLERQPMDLLILLVERRGQLVTRDEIVEKLWGPNVFVDVETGVHTAIAKIRRALRDSPDAPTFLDTVPGKGYRFIAPVQVDDGPAAPTALAASDSERPRLAEAARDPLPSAPQSPAPSRAFVAAVALTVAGLGAFSGRAWHETDLSPREVTLGVLPFDNLSGDPEAEYLASGLADEVIVALGQIDPAHVHVVGRTSIMSYRHSTKSP